LALELDLPTHPSGCLWFESQGAELDAQAVTLTQLGYPVQVLICAEIASLEPDLPNPPLRALRFPTETATDLAAMTLTLLAAASALGAQVWLGTPVLSLHESGGRVTGIDTAQGPVQADHVILATGTATPALLAPLGLTFPMLHRPGAILRTAPVALRLTHILATPGQEVRQDASGRLLAPASANHQADSTDQITDSAANLTATTLSRLRAILPGQDIGAEQILLAARPVPGDGLPAIGPVLPGLSMAVMHSGATLAPLAADLLTAELLGNDQSPELAPFRPARLLVKS
jgi:glycine/D-amino acid oxidase-like deaminating enzyme